MNNLITKNLNDKDYDLEKSYTAIWLAMQPNYAIYQSGGLTEANLKSAIKQHIEQVPRLLVLEGYRKGIMAVYNRMRMSELEREINYRLIFPEPRYIATTVNGFAFGKGAAYKMAEEVFKETGVEENKALDNILKLYRRQNINSVDQKIEDYMSTYGLGLELTYIDYNGEPKSSAKRPTEAFVVYDNEDEKNALYGVVYTRIYTDKDKEDYYEVAVYDYENYALYRTNDISCSSLSILKEPEPHNIKTLPLTEVWNNDERIGDFEPVISLIDAKNDMGSDNVNAIRQFIENILVFYGISLGNDEAEADKQYRKIKKKRWFSTKFATGSRLENVVQQMDHAGMDLAKNSITRDIAKYSFVPDFTSERFLNIQSGVAMSFSLMGLKALIGVKTPYLVGGLQQRLQKYSNVLSTKGQEPVDVLDVEISFNDMTPALDLEVANITSSALQVGVKPEVIAMRYSFVKDKHDLEEREETRELTLDELFASNSEATLQKEVEEETEG